MSVQRRTKKVVDDERKAEINARDGVTARRSEAYLGSLKPDECTQVENEAIKNNPFKMTRAGSAFRVAII
jgi:hypothetical protein